MIGALNCALTSCHSMVLNEHWDDSANRRIAVPEAFLAVDGILLLYGNIVKGLEVHEKVIVQHILEELPFLASSEILKKAVEKGGNETILRERLTVHSKAASQRIRDEGLDNNFE
jgi:adenylosuccinate lyase